MKDIFLIFLGLEVLFTGSSNNFLPYYIFFLSNLSLSSSPSVLVVRLCPFRDKDSVSSLIPDYFLLSKVE